MTYPGTRGRGGRVAWALAGRVVVLWGEVSQGGAEGRVGVRPVL